MFTLESGGIFLTTMVTICFEADLGIYFMTECRIYFATEKEYSAHTLCFLDCVLRLTTENNVAQFIPRETGDRNVFLTF